MSFSCPHFDINRDGCLRLHKACVPGRPGCVLTGAVFAVPVEQRIREREEADRKRAALEALRNASASYSGLSKFVADRAPAVGADLRAARPKAEALPLRPR